MSRHPALPGAALSAAVLTLSACVSVPVTAPPPVAPAPTPAPAPAPAPSLRVVAAGSAAQPASLAAITQGQVVTINTVQPLHTAATPRFNGLSLAAPAGSSADALLGWNRSTGDVVATPLPAPPTAPSATLSPRYIRSAAELRVADADQLLVVQVSGPLALPTLAPGSSGAREGRVVVIKSLVGGLVVSGLEGDGRLTLARGQTLTVVAATRLEQPQWLAISKP